MTSTDAYALGDYALGDDMLALEATRLADAVRDTAFATVIFNICEAASEGDRSTVVSVEGSHLHNFADRLMGLGYTTEFDPLTSGAYAPLKIVWP